ncbi:putative peptidase_S74 domain-containing structural protein [Rhizobium phage RHEph18]|uniref:tail fiber domain-containing protein n=1 Tax=Rhizobium TaxID=379 RepID=UPI0007EA5389|nr:MULTISPECIES: tail fiber domain-containing protein [Rhizobium]ANL02702.1 peptidase S74 family domain-containing protein [Rhizobium esperanzae]ANM33554.1 peptidase S74 family domain-containing protein [Rhizobium sp. N871]QIG73704.1 putative peptidase_S74 domain-containing structural protein [Rhizobium phage RHph_N2]QXV74422.1 putative peptidase_S74 domain-containing structural protein [Rhizobium phage RHEph18]
MIGKPKAPKAPDPKETAAAQTGTNVTTALANAQLGNVNQYGPDGSVVYSTSGSKSFTDPTTGATYNIPQYTQTTTLSPEQQAIKAQTDAASLNLGTIANQQSNFLKDYLAKPVNLDTQATEARTMELANQRLAPVIAQRDEDLRTRLANQGIKAGSEAYDREVNNFNQGTNDAYNQLILNGHQQAVQDILTQRNQPLNEISALMSGSQVGMPQFGAGTNQPSLPTVDYSGLVEQNYQNQLGAYNTQMQQSNSLIGGLFGLGGKLIGLSDERAKTDIKKVGELSGHKLYSYKYKKGRGDGKHHVGVMAQEVEKKRPDAVSTRADGLKQVDYGKLFGAGAK